MAQHTCRHCGQAFVTRRSVSTFCSMDCRNLEYKRRGASQPGTFRAGERPGNVEPVGTVTIRTRHKRAGEVRAYVKVAEPNVWELRARVVWEQARGPIPPGMVIHHVSRDKLDDRLENLEMVDRGEHLREHRSEFEAKRAVAAMAARWGHAAPSANKSI